MFKAHTFFFSGPVLIKSLTHRTKSGKRKSGKTKVSLKFNYERPKHSQSEDMMKKRKIGQIRLVSYKFMADSSTLLPLDISLW